MAPVQRHDEAVELVAERLEIRGCAFPCRGGQRCPRLPRGPQLIEHRGFLGLGRMHFQAERAETDGVQAMPHHLERRCLGGDEEDGLPVREKLADDVGNRLALPGPGRSEQDEVL
ncbi:MAG: hypothetical protein ACREFU_05490, partial [Acetobacteraceae bacterium]